MPFSESLERSSAPAHGTSGQGRLVPYRHSDWFLYRRGRTDLADDSPGVSARAKPDFGKKCPLQVDTGLDVRHDIKALVEESKREKRKTPGTG
jgi:hypothetical protein